MGLVGEGVAASCVVLMGLSLSVCVYVCSLDLWERIHCRK